ncbi:hypothetical protein [Natrinema salifodinae]|uniref:Uncharacterized protein n=1 Tax=Natrinema salifodinae TaxID=1202768 RepID=A0A1I0NH08_9EURY|nr:hypothetical protein [Natrinema salifodinae]SEW00637.1 hypothetical protein SAMN05216285_1719 [Natrinema salifodinae]
MDRNTSRDGASAAPGTIGTERGREIVAWRKTTDDGTPVYEIEYDGPAPEPTSRSPTLFGASSGGTVPAEEQSVRLPDGEQMSARDAAFETEGTTLRIRHNPSLVDRVRRYLPW